MKKALFALAAAATLAAGTYAVRAQENPSVVSAGNAFTAIQPDMQGMVSQPIMHAPAGDLLAVYIGHAPKQVYSKQDLVLYVISGHGTATVGYPSYDLAPGSVVSVPRNTAFEILARGTAPIKAILLASPSDNPSDKRLLDQQTQ